LAHRRRGNAGDDLFRSHIDTSGHSQALKIP
jgi:hypothetical protein